MDNHTKRQTPAAPDTLAQARELLDRLGDAFDTLVVQLEDLENESLSEGLEQENAVLGKVCRALERLAVGWDARLVRLATDKARAAPRKDRARSRFEASDARAGRHRW